METRIRNEDSRKVINVNVQGSLETERSGQRGYYLSNESVEIFVGRALNVER
jgi:hypothetical protein